MKVSLRVLENHNKVACNIKYMQRLTLFYIRETKFPSVIYLFTFYINSQ